MRFLKPQVLTDITHPRRPEAFQSIETRVDLLPPPEWRFPWGRTLQGLFLVCSLWALIIGAASAPTVPARAEASTSESERAALEAQLKDLEGQIDAYESQIVSYQKQGKNLQGEIGSLNSKIAKLNLQIKAIDLTIRQLDAKISDTETKISDTEASIAEHRTALGALVRSLAARDRDSLIETLLANPRLSDFFGDFANTAQLQTNIRTTITAIERLQNQLKDQKEQYAVARSDSATALKYQAAQRIETDSVKQAKNALLAATKGQESKYQSLLKETKATAAEIRKRIFQLLGGGELSFEDAYQFAKLASAATGVRPALILAVLDRESALGKNVGKCSYKDAMSPKNQPIFLQITQELNINSETMFVSCANADGAYGGAMGPAQFIPSTWVLYKDSIASVTGHKPPSPWNN
jgi:peptidoglycan hydrolase CwlO-like protein